MSLCICKMSLKCPQNVSVKFQLKIHHRSFIIDYYHYYYSITLLALHHHHQPEPLRQGRMDPCFHVLYTKFWLYHLNVAAEIENTDIIENNLQTRQYFFQSSIVQFWWACENHSLRFLLIGAAPSVVFCCCRPSASGFDVLCVQRWYSAFLGCNEWLFELLLPFYHL